MIRQAKLEDIGSIMLIINQAKEIIRQTGSPQWQNGYPDENTFKHDIRNKQLYVSVSIEGFVVGVMAVMDYEQTYDYIKGSWLNDGPYKVIHRIAVKNSHLNQNIAKSMIDFVFQSLCTSNIRIDTHEKNVRMIRFLEKEQFTHCGTIYLAQTDDSIRMAFHKAIL